MIIALGIEYEGVGFHGWQRQTEQMTLQGCLEQALSQIAATKIEVQCAGRTDAGVHATVQVVHFITDVERPLQAWVAGANSHLPSAMRVLWAKAMPEDFHARFKALARRYIYVIYNQSIRPALCRGLVSWHYRPLDAYKMHAAGQTLLGEQDFTSFRASTCQSKTPIRTIEHLKVTRQGDLVIIDIKANAFLHHMVRNIAGVLMAIGEEQQEIGWATQVLHAKDRKFAAVTAPPQGLYLVQVDYPEIYHLETQLRLPPLLHLNNP